MKPLPPDGVPETPALLAWAFAKAELAIRRVPNKASSWEARLRLRELAAREKLKAEGPQGAS